ncbi:MAG TPA: argininosuccinate lyase, partial [Planctomycetes bacterium]|nr:argininosuccinate lyase [Planctomycetota bacterium]
MKRLWDKGKPVDELVLDFCVGNDHILDERLVAHDIRASRAHATMLAEQGLISKEDHAAIDGGLAALAAEHEQGLWSIAKSEEDGHTAIERRLTERVGEAGARIHLGRSRNDQVLAALRLWMIATGEELAHAAESVAQALRTLGERQGSTPLPGYTHMQRAMPSSVALWAGGFAAEIEDDAEGLRQALRRARKCPLGSAAGYGVPLAPIDRARTAELLGFDEVQEPVT